MRDRLIEILYGGIYDASPGSDRHQEQGRRIMAALEFVEEEMAKKRSSPESQEERPSSFREKMVTKFQDDPEEAGSDGV